jgi:hypothetical protein
MKSDFEGFKMALMAHDGWWESRSSVRLRIGFALDSRWIRIFVHLLYLCVCSDEPISGDAWAYPKFALSLWGCAAPNWLVSYRCCSSPTQLGQQTACAFSISFSRSSTSIACPLPYHDLLAHARKHYYCLSVTIHSLYPSSLRLF